MIEILNNQLLFAFETVNASDVSKMYIAYEPVYAIGTGVSASIADAERAISFIKEFLHKKFNKTCKVLYGGSLKGSNASEILSVPCIDGGLIGRASLTAESFFEIINAKIN
jgi:triosephosphate isomerase